MFRHSFDTKTRVLLEMIVQGGSIESVYHCCTYSLKVSGGFSGSNFKAVSKTKSADHWLEENCKGVQ